MTNKPNPAKKSFANNSNLSTLNDSINLEVNNFLDKSFKAKTGRPAKLTFNNLLYCLKIKRKYTCDTWLGVYKCLLDKVKYGEVDFNLPTYTNFLKSIKRLIVYLFNLINYQVSINRQEFKQKQFRIAFVDSTALPVCKVIRSGRHQTMKEFAEYSKSTMG